MVRAVPGVLGRRRVHADALARRRLAVRGLVCGVLGGLLWGVVARYLGIGLEKTGVPSVDEPPAIAGEATYA